ncbi:MAG TPA: hypothetical protein VFV67_18355 [Actinophytocola sp.]|uniref:hypothetical protein n=1 Tax=Actinophytocola sp. TaxID=1872138 RepID=UPI002DB9CBDE|nr:hypothetical protein [Actinophytocola sp.]HEU5472613.1 hypothetical protein [Actinophytocola sp.]
MFVEPPARVIGLGPPLDHYVYRTQPAILSRMAVRRFVGYMNSQRERMLGTRGGAPSRPELVARYGYDVKYASHALRLVYQGLEILRDGHLTLPMPEAQRQRVLRVKRGEVPAIVDVLAEIADVQAEIERRLAAGDTPLPPQPDLARISTWSTTAHRRFWDWT